MVWQAEQLCQAPGLFCLSLGCERGVVSSHEESPVSGGMVMTRAADLPFPPRKRGARAVFTWQRGESGLCLAAAAAAGIVSMF